MKKAVKERHLTVMVSLLMLSLMIIGCLAIIVEDVKDTETPVGKVEVDGINKDEEIPDYGFSWDGYIPYIPDPTPFTLSQPDGTEFEARMVGDRTGGHVETLTGYTIIEDSHGWWTYARKDENGVLVPTSNRVGEVGIESALGYPKHLTNDPPETGDYGYGNSYRGTRSPPTNGTTKGIAIMLSFDDVDFDPDHDQTHFTDLLNGTSGNTMRTYYREVSYDIFDIEVDVVGPFKSSKTMAYYGADVGPKDNNPNTRDDGNGSVTEMAKEAVELADPSVDFSPYDIDGDDVIDALFIIHAGPGQESGGGPNAIWSHMSIIFSGVSTDDGVSAFAYSTEPEDGEVGVFAHEFGHILGLPDLYDTNGNIGGYSSGIGNWGLMASGSWTNSGKTPAHFCAWAKIVLGWVEPIIVTSDVSLTQIEIPPVETHPVVYKIWAHDPSLNIDEYFLVENRQKEGYDSYLPGEGILVWHINESHPNNNNPDLLKVDLEEADGPPQDLEQGSNSGDIGDPWVGQAKNFTATSDPNSTAHNGSSTGAWVWNFSNIFANGNMSLGFKEIYSGPTGIFISDPITNTTIKPVYDFILNDTDFPDEDIGYDNEGNNGSYVLEYRHTNTSESWNVTPSQTPKSWVGGVKGIINCTALEEGFWDFRVKILDEEGHLLYTPIVINIAVPTKIPPTADAGPDNFTDVNAPILLDGSGSTDNSGYIPWFNWTFGDGTYYNGSEPKVVHIYSEPGNYTVILNVSDSFGNWDTDIVNITVSDIGPPDTMLAILEPKYRENEEDNWNVSSDTLFMLSAVDNYSGVNFTWYTIDGVYKEGEMFKIEGYDDGLHNLTWGSEDYAGNNETNNSMIICLDNTAPVTSIDIDVPKYRNQTGDYWNVTNTTLFTLLPYDQYSGVDYTWYSINANFYFGTSFTLAGFDDGLISIIWSSVDNVDNYKIYNTTVNLDTTPPITNISVGTPRFRAQATDNWNVTPSTELSMQDNGDGNGSGINFTWYTVDGVFYVYSAPFTLTPGTHTIIWGGVDNLGMNETGKSMLINVDVEPPITNLNIDLPKFRKNAIDAWNVSIATQFTLQSSDQHSGVNFSWYTIDGDYFEGASFYLLGYIEGLHSITWGSVDNLGNNEAGNSIEVYLDSTPPTTVLSIGDPKHRDSTGDYWNVTSSTQFSMVSSDLQSGVNVTWYTVDGDYFEGETFSLSGYSDGLHTITYGGKDNVWNNETANMIIVILDGSPPITDLSIGTPKFRGTVSDNWNVTDTTLFSLSPSDQYSGVNGTWYTIDGQYFEGLSFTLAGLGEGLHTITWGSVDNLGNNETSNTIIINLDTSPPITNINIGMPRYRAQITDNWNVSDSTEFTITHNGDGSGSGINFTWYTIDGIFHKYSAPFTLTSGLHTIICGGVDNLGMNETGDSQQVMVDVQPPKTNLDIGSPKFRESATDIWNVTNATDFTLQSSDQYSGVDYSWYTINGEYFESASFNLLGYVDALYTITWGSIDNVGNNETGNSIQVYLDSGPPTTALSIGDPKYRSSVFDYWNVTSSTEFTLFPSDQLSGVNITWYTIDNKYFEGELFYLSGYSDGMHTITWGSKDNLGNNETGNIVLVILDTNPPITDLSIATPKFRDSVSDNWNVTDTTLFTLSPSDQYSGVNTIWYTIDGSYFEGSSFNLTGYVDGLHTITWGSVDNLGNNEIGNSMTVNLDTTPPATNIIIGIPRFRASATDYWNVTDLTEFTVTDNGDGVGSGIDLVWYEVDGVFYEYTAPFTLVSGPHTISWGARDNLGMNKTGGSTLVIVDVNSPTTDLIIGTPAFRLNPTDIWNVTAATTFTLQSSDQYSGVEFIWYTINVEFYKGTNFDLSGLSDGIFTITWGAIDNLGNNETGNNIVLALDNSPPITNLSIGQPCHRNNANDYWNVTSTTSFTLSPSDQFSGVDFTWYMIDGSYFEGLSFNLLGYVEGLHTLNWGSVDHLGWNETNTPMIVNLNNTSPMTSITIQGLKYRAFETDFWNVTSSSIFKLNPIYTPSEVDFTWYFIDGKYFEGDTFTLSGYDEGEHYLIWGSRDKLGYNETGNLWTVLLDNTEPTSAIDIGEPKYPLIPILNITDLTPINLSSDDGSGCGIASIYYQILNDAGLVLDWTEYQFGTLFIDLYGYGDGDYTIIFNATDHLGNKELNNYYYLYLDNSGPITNIIVGEPKHRAKGSDYWNVTSNTEFSLFSSDFRTEVNTIWYTIDGQYFEGETFDLLGEIDGTHLITWGGIDALGNNRTGGSTVVILDTNPPITDLEIGAPKYRVSIDENWYLKDTTLFTLTSFDQYSGVKLTWHTIDSEYFEGMIFNLAGFDEGLHTISWGSIDNLGNNETGNTIDVCLDISPPATDMAIGTPKYRTDGEDYWNVTSKTTFTLTPTDQYSGVNFTWYTIDGNYFKGLMFNLDGYEDGLYTITWGSTDNLGMSETSNVMLINLDNTAPSISVEFGSPNRIVGNVTHITSSTPITLIPLDSGVGKTTLYYSIDGGTTYSLFASPFTVPSATTSIIYGGEDALGNRAGESTIAIVVDNRDNDRDGIYDLGDPDDDNDGLWDSDEDKNQNGIVDEGETDPLNPDTDGDGHDDMTDKYPLDKSKWKEPSDWEKLPIVGGYEQSLCINLVIIFVIVLILLIIIMKQYRKWKARKSWKEAPASEPSNGFDSEPGNK